MQEFFDFFPEFLCPQYRLTHVSHHVQAAKGQHQSLGTSLAEGLLYTLGNGAQAVTGFPKEVKIFFNSSAGMARGLSGVTATNRGDQGSHGFVHVGVILVGHDAGERCGCSARPGNPGHFGPGLPGTGDCDHRLQLHRGFSAAAQTARAIPHPGDRPEYSLQKCSSHGGSGSPPLSAPRRHCVQLMAPRRGDFQWLSGNQKVEHLPRKAV